LAWFRTSADFSCKGPAIAKYRSPCCKPDNTYSIRCRTLCRR
jgi:hypothetical protein